MICEEVIGVDDKCFNGISESEVVLLVKSFSNEHICFVKNRCICISTKSERKVMLIVNRQ